MMLAILKVAVISAIRNYRHYFLTFSVFISDRISTSFILSEVDVMI